MNILKRIKINKQNIIDIYNLLIKYLSKYKHIIFMTIPLILMDIITRYIGKDISFFPITEKTPNLFTILWISLIISLSLNFKKRIGKLIYSITSYLFLFIFFSNIVYYNLTKTFFDFNLLVSAKEGSPYILDTLKNTNIIYYIITILLFIIIRKTIKTIPYKTKSNYKYLFLTIIIFSLIHAYIPTTLGEANSELTWSSWRNPRNVYISFNDSNKSLKVSGLYEYTIRNFYITFIKTESQENTEDIEFLNIAFEDKEQSENKYSELFKGKNLIFIQLEGLDNWIIDEETTPTITKMLENSINFTNHYSYYNGGGSTFNSEFAVNTGFITPLSYTQNAYTFNKNKFPYSMANLFKKEGYVVNAFHMNTGEYYSRTANYKNWGYNNYYGLIDMFDYTDESYKLDRELILNEKFNNLIFQTNNPDQLFVDYIITYSGHLPFTNNKGVCKLLYEEEIKKQVEQMKIDNPEIDETIEEKNIEFKQLSELECIKKQNRETDYMLELLLQNLEEKNLIDNTVIIVFTDHYLYTIEDKSILDKYKTTNNNLINKTPFFIWSKDMKKTTINKVTSQLNILPTTLNLFGIKHNPNNYIGTDALSSNYEGIVFFSDYSWYDGNVYVENAEVTNNKSISYEKLEEKNYYISNITKKNDLALKYNYFKIK